jgi:hypothetical protein
MTAPFALAANFGFAVAWPRAVTVASASKSVGCGENRSENKNCGEEKQRPVRVLLEEADHAARAVSGWKRSAHATEFVVV